MGIDKINNQDFPQSTTAPATTTPTISLNSATPAFGNLVVTVTNHSDYTNPNYSVTSALADGTVTVTDANVDRALESDLSHLSATLTVVDGNASTAQRTVSVKAQEFEDRKQSAAVTATYTPSFIQNKYIRITGTDSDGDAVASRMSIGEIRFYDGAGQSGTAYPTTNLTADDSETGIVVSAGYYINATYGPWKAADASATNTLFWTLGISTAADNWWQIEFEDGTYSTKPIIKSLKIGFKQWTDPTHIKITSSANADHSSATTHGIFPITQQSNYTENIG